MAGYQANIIQFGIDQLFEAQSHYLGLFIHYTSWAFHIRALVPLASFPLIWCDHLRRTAQKVLCSVGVVGTLSLITLFVVILWKKHWFYSEAGWESPYKAVLKIMIFAKRHKHPLQRSAFTYADHPGLILPMKDMEDLSQQNKLKVLRHCCGFYLFCLH